VEAVHPRCFSFVCYSVCLARVAHVCDGIKRLASQVGRSRTLMHKQVLCAASVCVCVCVCLLCCPLTSCVEHLHHVCFAIGTAPPSSHPVSHPFVLLRGGGKVLCLVVVMINVLCYYLFSLCACLPDSCSQSIVRPRSSLNNLGSWPLWLLSNPLPPASTVD